jgi:hypothetical protein
MTTITETIDLSALGEENDSLEVGDGVTLRLRIHPDEHTSINDYRDVYGRIEYIGRTSWDTGRRPDGFTGNAEKLGIGQSYDRYWWEPSPEGPKRGTPEFAKERQQVLNLLEFGFIGVVLERWERCDHCGTERMTESASLWGIENNADEAYLQETLRELLYEINDNIKRKEQQ